MLSDAKHMLDKYTKHYEHILCKYYQYADYGQCMCRATMPTGEKDGGKKEKKKKKKRKGGS